jgi:hypothetical protein
MGYKDTERYKRWLEKRFPKKVKTETQEIREKLVNEKREAILKYGFADTKNLNKLEIFYIKLKITDEKIVVKESEGRLYIPIYA